MNEFQSLYDATIAKMEAMVVEYNAQEFGVPDRLKLKAQAILGAADLDAAGRAAHKAEASAQIYYLSMWALKKIPGKITPQNVEAKARKAESLADHLDRIGLEENAEQQRERAQRLRDLAKP